MKRIFACVFIMAVLPLMTSPTRHVSSNSVPFETTALAGHSSAQGFWCNWCNCEPGADDVCPCCGADLTSRAMADQPNEDSSVQDTPSTTSQPDSNSDAGVAALLLLVALMAWSRM